MLVLALPRQLVESAVPAVERHLARRPGGWSWVGARGRLRRYAGDRRGLVDLERAADTYLEVFQGRDPDLLVPSNLYRLAGSDEAAPRLAEARAQLEEATREGHGAVRTGSLVDVCFLQGDDEQAQRYLTALEAADPAGVRGTRYPAVARLAAGRAVRDVEACDDAVAHFDALVAREPASFVDAGGPNAYDWLEIALVTRSEVAGEVSSRLLDV